MLLRWFLLVPLLGSLGCVSVYSPPGPVVPMFRKAGDLSVGANVRPFMPTRGANVYVAAAPSEHTRLTLSGSMSHYDGRTATDYSERTMAEKNHTLQLDVGGGWGTTRGNAIFEVLAGVGYGTVNAHACRREYNLSGNYGIDCSLWIDTRAWFVRPYVQGQVGRRWETGHLAGGMRMSALHYDLEELVGQPSTRTATVPTLEPFLSASKGLPWGKLEAQFLVPLVLYSPEVTVVRQTDSGGSHSDYTGALIISASPRFTVGLRADLTDLWGS
jgi:hypothetical protein